MGTHTYLDNSILQDKEAVIVLLKLGRLKESWLHAETYFTGDQNTYPNSSMGPTWFHINGKI